MYRWFAVILLVVVGGCGWVNRTSGHEGKDFRALDESVLTPPGLRLPRDFVVERYDLELTVDPDRPTMTGSVRITGRLLRQTPVIWLHAEEITFGAAKLTAGGSEIPLEVIAGRARGRVALRATAPLPLGPSVIVIDYTAAIQSTESTGTFRQRSGADWYVFTHHEPISARRSVPCFDEPDIKVPWRVRLTVPAATSAVSNAPIELEAVAGGVRHVTFAPTDPIPAYLLAYAVGRFEYVDAGASAYGAPIRIITPRGRAADAAWAVEATPKILAALEHWFGTPYPFPKLDSIAIPMTSFGAMENPGLITYRESLLLQPMGAADRRREAYAEVAAHELAHQWFGNLVTPAWWDDIWLAESFATWLPAKVLAGVYPAWHRDEDASVARNDSLESDSLGTARAIRQPIATEDDIVTVFDGITYGKGAAVLRTLEEWLGAERFQLGVRAYLARHARGNATGEDFVSALAVQAPEAAVSAVLASLLDQAGAPRLIARTECPKGKPAQLTLSQGRYLPLGATAGATPRWHLPVCVQVGYGAKTATPVCTLLAGGDATLALPRCPLWVWPNAGGRGYFRSSLAESEWRTLRSRAWPLLSGPERLAAVQDLLAATAAGEVAITVALELVPELANANTPALAALAVELIEEIEAWVPAEHRAAFARWVVKQFAPLAGKLDATPAARGGSELERLRGAVVGLVADVGGDPAWRDRAVASAADWRNLPDAIRGDTLAIAVRAKPELQDALLAALKTEIDRTLRTEIARALGSIPDGARLEASLMLLLDPQLDIRVSTPILTAALNRGDTRAIAEGFVLAHLDALIARMPGESPLRLLAAITSSCDATKIEPMRALAGAKLGGKRGAPRRIDQAFERMAQCAARRGAAEPALAGWLAKLPRP